MKKILIVEDERQLITMVKARLEKEGYEVLSCLNGEEALKITQEKNPDLVILDIVLPGGMGGYEICSRLRAQKQTEAIPIIMFSSRSGDIDKAMGFKCGANDYIVKPYDPKILVDKINGFLAET